MNAAPRTYGVTLCLLLTLLTSLASEARQLSFSRDGLTLNYRWQPPASAAQGATPTQEPQSKETQSLSLTLPEQSELRFFSGWRPDAARRLSEAQRMRQAYALRALSDKGVAFKVIGSMLGQLLLRVMARGEVYRPIAA